MSRQWQRLSSISHVLERFFHDVTFVSDDVETDEHRLGGSRGRSAEFDRQPVGACFAADDLPILTRMPSTVDPSSPHRLSWNSFSLLIPPSKAISQNSFDFLEWSRAVADLVVAVEQMVKNMLTALANAVVMVFLSLPLFLTMVVAFPIVL